MPDSLADAERDPFIWPYRAGKMGPLGNRPGDLRDQERLLNAIEETDVKHVGNNARIELLGYPGIVSYGRPKRLAIR